MDLCKCRFDPKTISRHGVDHVGYYRVVYSADLLGPLIRKAFAGSEGLTEAEKFGLLADVFARKSQEP